MEKLPVELLEKVFEFLPHEDRKSVALVNSLWRKAGEAPHLWTWIELPRVEDQNSCARVIKMLRDKRLARLWHIDIRPDSVSEDLLRAMIQHRGLEKIQLEEGGELLSGLNSQLVIEALTRMESLDLYSPFPTHLLIGLLTEVSEGRSTLKRLYLWDNKLGELPAALVISASTRLVEVDLGYSQLTSDQVAALMEAIDQGNSSIEKLSLSGSLPSEDERPLNLKPLVKLEVVSLWNNSLTQQELVNFFSALSPSTKLRELYIRIDYEEMDWSTDLLAKAINFLEEVHLTAFPYQVCIQFLSPEVQIELTKDNIVIKS